MIRRHTTAALQCLVEAGFHCFVLEGKRPPSGTNGWKDATNDLLLLAESIVAHPTATNIGVQPGASGWVVVDLDLHKKAEKCPAYHRLLAYAEQFGGLPETLTVRTGSGGLHLYFRANPRIPLGQKNGIYNPETGGRPEPGVDVRGDAGYVVAPPSVHPETGEVYAWETNSGGFEPDQMVEIPDWFALWLAATRPQPTQLQREVYRSEALPDSPEARRVAGMVAARCKRIAALGEGTGRRTEINAAARYFAGLLWTGYPEARLRAELIDAAIACGKWNRDTQRFFEYGIETGKGQHVDLPPDSPGWTPRGSSRRQAQRTPQPQSTQGAPVGDDEIEVAYQTTPDGRPYLVAPPGTQSGVYVARDAEGFVFIREKWMLKTLKRYWPELETTYTTGGENPQVKAMTDVMLWDRYGAQASEIYYTYIGSSRFEAVDKNEGRLYMRTPAIVQNVPAVKHDEVLEWLQILCGDQYETMLDWLATVAMLDRPTAVPVLIGDSGTGKSILGDAVSRYFGPSITAYDGIMRNQFNDALLRSPIVLLDEKSEVDTRSGALRSLSANSRHSIEPKGQASGTLLGCPRTFITSNEDDPLQLARETLSLKSEKAIGDRLFIVDCNPAAKTWIEERGGRRGVTREWLDRIGGAPGKICETIAWLIQNRTVTLGTRLLVEGDAVRYAARISSRTGLQKTILSAIEEYLSWDSPQREALAPAHPFLFDAKYPDHVLVFNMPLRAAWEQLLGERPPSHRKMSDSLCKLSDDKECKRRTLANKTRAPRCAMVPKSLLDDPNAAGSENG